MAQLSSTLLTRSAQLCDGYTEVNRRIGETKAAIASAKKWLQVDPYRIAIPKAKRYIEYNHFFKFSHVLWAFAAAVIPSTILYIVGARQGRNLFYLLALAAGIAIFVLVYLVQHRKYEAKLYSQRRSDLIQHFELQIQKAKASLEKDTQQLQQLTALKARILQRLQDDRYCCVPQKYWPIGAKLCQMVQSGQASSIQQAIAVYHAPKHRPQKTTVPRPSVPRPPVTTTASDEGNWRKLQEMMEHNIAAELRQTRTEQFLDALVDLAFLEALDA